MGEINYEVVFDNVNGFRPGDVVTGPMVAQNQAGVEYLLTVGAVKITEKAQKVNDASTAIQAKVDEAVAAARTNDQASIASLTEQIESLTKQVDDLEADKEMLITTNEELTVQVKALEEKIANPLGIAAKV